MAETQDARKQAEQAGERASTIVEKIRHSKYGQKIPLEMDRVTLKMLLRTTLVAKLGYVTPAYLIVTLTSVPGNALAYVVNFIKSFYVFIALADIAVEICISMSKMRSLYIGIIASLIIKNAALLLITLCYVIAAHSFLCFIMWLGFIVSTLAIDFSFAYYVGVYFNDMPDDEADSDGKRTQEEIAAQI